MRFRADFQGDFQWTQSSNPNLTQTTAATTTYSTNKEEEEEEEEREKEEKLTFSGLKTLTTTTAISKYLQSELGRKVTTTMDHYKGKEIKSFIL